MSESVSFVPERNLHGDDVYGFSHDRRYPLLTNPFPVSLMVARRISQGLQVSYFLVSKLGWCVRMGRWLR